MDCDYKAVKTLFPEDTKVIHFAGSPEKYTALLRSKCRNKEEFRQNWLNQFQKLSKVALRVLLTRPKTGKKVVYKAAFRCQHNTYPASHQRVKTPHRKHTGCPAILKVTIKASPENRRVRSIDALRGEYPTIISITHDHNHQLINELKFPDDYYSTRTKTLERISELKYETELNENNVKEMDWNFLKHCWNSFFERCESTNSLQLYKALWKATNCLDSCKTINTTIDALNIVRKNTIKKKCDDNVFLQGESLPKKIFCSEINNKSVNTKVVVSSVVDELLVKDQKWIVR